MTRALSALLVLAGLLFGAAACRPRPPSPPVAPRAPAPPPVAQSPVPESGDAHSRNPLRGFLAASPEEQARIAVRMAEVAATLPEERRLARQAGLALSARELRLPRVSARRNAAPVYRALDRLLTRRPLDREQALLASRLGDRQPTPAEEAQVRRFLADRREVGELVFRATGLPDCSFGRNWDLGPALQFPEHARMREAARWLKAEAYFRAAEGRFTEAVSIQAGGFQLARHLSSEPGLIAFLVAIACDSITLGGLGNLLRARWADDRAFAAVAATVRRYRVQLDLSAALRVEAVMMEVAFGVYRTGKMWAADGPWGEGGTTPDPRLMAPEARRSFLVIGAAAHAEYLQIARRTYLAALRPEPRRLSALKEVDATRRSADPANPAEVFRSSLAIDIHPVEQKRLQLMARRSVLLAAAALLRHRLRTGTLPERLEDAVRPLPPDPYSGLPLRYRREGPGFVIYSAGPDGLSAGGRPGERVPPERVAFRYP